MLIGIISESRSPCPGIRRAAAWGQTAQIVGTITDSSGARVPGTRITVINVNTDLQRTDTSNMEGYYTVALLPTGEYRITAQKEGFELASRSGIVLAVGNKVALKSAQDGKTSQENVTRRNGTPGVV